ncbi:MAG: signal recognition particle-docking protein FtsY [Anaerolineales bacterium]|nr:signal recognition particle-docking protein FtsY [Anaerolineales bacterium]
MNENRWRETLSKTRRSALGRLSTILGATELTPEFWGQLEEILIQADLGINTVLALIEQVKKSASDSGCTSGDQVRQLLRTSLLQQLQITPGTNFDTKPHVIIVVGVNGSGKTTTVARIAKRFLALDHSVLLAAADTYRAAASEQLAVWGQRLGVDVVSGQAGSDPGAVVFDACTAAQARKIDIVIVDTSGRMHTQHNLMQELKKICRVARKVVPEAPHQVLLVLDATTGQNGLAQARSFIEAVGITGVVLAKLDSSAKGGVGFAIGKELGLPIQFVGTGEALEDLAEFDPDAYVESMLPQGGF